MICLIKSHVDFRISNIICNCMRIFTVILCFCFITASGFAQTLPTAPPPSAEFISENINDTGKWSLQFPTVRGYAYQVEESTDLENWTPSANGHFYGNGNTQKCFICDGPIPPATSTSSNSSGNGPNWVWALRTINLKFIRLQMAKARAPFACIGPVIPQLELLIHSRHGMRS
jgi:hypothetical protein